MCATLFCEAALEPIADIAEKDDSSLPPSRTNDIQDWCTHALSQILFQHYGLASDRHKRIFLNALWKDLENIKANRIDLPNGPRSHYTRILMLHWPNERGALFAEMHNREFSDNEAEIDAWIADVRTRMRP